MSQQLDFLLLVEGIVIDFPNTHKKVFGRTDIDTDTGVTKNWFIVDHGAHRSFFSDLTEALVFAAKPFIIPVPADEKLPAQLGLFT